MNFRYQLAGGPIAGIVIAMHTCGLQPFLWWFVGGYPVLCTMYMTTIRNEAKVDMGNCKEKHTVNNTIADAIKV